jgi:threonine synthase
VGVIANLVCGLCAQQHKPGHLSNLCVCGGPLLVQYDLNSLRISNPQTLVSPGVPGMWRYEKLLPADAAEAVTLGEGWTPLIRLNRLASELGANNVWLKDEGRNPTDSFKARGLSAAVTMAKKLGAAKLAIPSAGNAASALAAYAAAAGMEAHIFMPSDVPQANFIECKAYGAKVTLVDGLINDCGRIVAERKSAEGWFDVSTLKEPYRIEGKKTMGFEVAEQFGWQLPDAILYPCGGGVGLIGMWKAFAELEALGIVGGKRPKMIAVQAAGCQPLTRAFKAGAARSEIWNDAHTVASGLRVPKPLGDFLILQAIRESEGTVVSITDEDMLDAGILLAEREGIFPAPEGGACVAAAAHLLKTAFLKPADRIVIYNTGSGLKYQEAYATRFPRRNAGEFDKLGGLITPR